MQNRKTSKMEMKFEVIVSAFNDYKMRCHFTTVDMQKQGETEED